MLQVRALCTQPVSELSEELVRPSFFYALMEDDTMSASWQTLRPEILDLLTARVSLTACVQQHGLQAVDRALRWCVRSGASEALMWDWFAQGALSLNLELRQVTCLVLCECDVNQLAGLVRHLKEVHHKLPRSLRTRIVRQLSELEEERELELFAALHYDVLRYLHATLHIKPSTTMQALLFDAPRPKLGDQGSDHLGWSPGLDAISRGRLVVQVYVESTRFVDELMHEALQVWLEDMAERGLFSCELYRLSGDVSRCYPVESSVRGWRDAMRALVAVGEMPGAERFHDIVKYAHMVSNVPVRHIVYVCDASTVSEDQARAWCQRVVSLTESATQECLVSVIRWGGLALDDEGHVVSFEGSRGCVWRCVDRVDMLSNTMAYMLV